MAALRGFLVGFANFIILIVLVLATLGGFIGLGNANPYAGFSFGMALLGGIIGFLFGCASMCVLAVLLDIRDLLHRQVSRDSRV